MKHKASLWRELEKAGFVTNEEVALWVRETMPVAKALIPDSSIHFGKDIDIEVEFIAPHMTPMGRWMGCFPSLKGGKAHLFVIPDWSFFLYALYLSVHDTSSDPKMVRVALLDRSRIRMGITNDVFQPYAPLPEPFSMLRHHSLMLFLAIEWLPGVAKHRWRTICHDVGTFVAHELSAKHDPLQTLQIWEEEANHMMHETALTSCTKLGAVQILQDETVMRTIGRYLAATHLGIHVLNVRYLRSEQPELWIENEIRKLSNPDYLCSEIHDYIKNG